MIEIPLTSDPSQLFSIQLNELTYEIGVIYNSRMETWFLSVAKDGVNILAGVGLLAGVDIFKQYTIPIKNAYIVGFNDPTINTLGTDVKLYILTDFEVTSIVSIL